MKVGSMFRKLVEKWDSFKENKLSEHWNLTKNITLYGENAMHWAVNIKTKKFGYVCFRLPFRCFGGWWPLYFYVSPNGTPWASTFCRGKGKRERKNAKLRKDQFGHNYNTDDYEEEMREIRESI